MTRGIDHLVLAVRDLDAAAHFYERLGFLVGARNRHPWGTENRIVQLAGSFLELITIGVGAQIPPHAPGVFSFGAFVRDFLARREGLAMLALASADAAADAGHFAASGLGSFAPFSFERRGRRPDGTETRVAFTLAFAQAPLTTGAGFFVCQHHHPENFWNEAFQRHANRAIGVSSVALAMSDPQAHVDFLAALTGSLPERRDGHELKLPLAGARLDVVTPAWAAAAFGRRGIDAREPGFVAFGVAVADVHDQATRLDRGAVPSHRSGGRLVVPSSTAFGVAIAFEEASGGPEA